MMFKKLLLMKFVPLSSDSGLLALRLIPILTLFLKHGIEKLFTYSAVQESMLAHHGYIPAVGITISMICATLADGVCGLLLVLGLATRWAAIGSFTSLFVVWTVNKHMSFLAKTPEANSGELLVAYLGVLVCLFLSGAGRFSLDALLDRASSGARKAIE